MATFNVRGSLHSLSDSAGSDEGPFACWRPALVLLSVAALVLTMMHAAYAITLNEFPVPSQTSEPFRLTNGPDCNIWFTERNANRIGVITPEGAITEFSVPTIDSRPMSIAAGPDGNLWFTEQAGNKIGRISTAGVIINEFPIPTADSEPNGIILGPDGNLWFTEQAGNKIGRISTAGVITEFPVPTADSQPNSIRTGPDGNLWFTEQAGNKIGQMTTNGIVINEFPIPTANSQPRSIKIGPDGELWFAEANANKIGRITTDGVVTEFPSAIANSNPNILTTGPDGNIWFTVMGTNGNRIAQMTTTGLMTAFPIPTASSFPGGIVTGPDGNLWFTEINGNKIGRGVIAATMLAPPVCPRVWVVTPAAAAPVTGVMAEQANPIGVGSVAAGGGTVELMIGLERFSQPVDIYFLLFLPDIDAATIYNLTYLWTLQPIPLSAFSLTGLIPLKANATGPVDEGLFGSIPTSTLPAGDYYFGIVVTPAGDQSFTKIYFWVTSFTL